MGFGSFILSTLKSQIEDLKGITRNKLPELRKAASQGKNVFPQLEKLEKLITTTEKTLDTASKTIDTATKTAEGIQTAAKNGGITEVGSVDYQVYGGLFVSKYKTIVTGR